MIELLLQAERALSVGLLDRAETLYRQVAERRPAQLDRGRRARPGGARSRRRGGRAGAGARALEIDPENDAAIRLVARLEEVIDYRHESAAWHSAWRSRSPNPNPRSRPQRLSPRRSRPPRPNPNPSQSRGPGSGIRPRWSRSRSPVQSPHRRPKERRMPKRARSPSPSRLRSPCAKPDRRRNLSRSRSFSPGRQPSLSRQPNQDLNPNPSRCPNPRRQPAPPRDRPRRHPARRHRRHRRAVARSSIACSAAVDLGGDRFPHTRAGRPLARSTVAIRPFRACESHQTVTPRAFGHVRPIRVPQRAPHARMAESGEPVSGELDPGRPSVLDQ